MSEVIEHIDLPSLGVDILLRPGGHFVISNEFLELKTDFRHWIRRPLFGHTTLALLLKMEKYKKI